MNENENNSVQNENEKSYSPEEIQAFLESDAGKKAIDSRADVRVQSALDKQARKNEAKLREAEKLAKMSSDEQYAYQLEQREKAIAEKESELALMENKNQVSKILAEKNLSLEFVDFVVSDDAEVMNQNIKILERAFNQSVQAEVERRIGSNNPKRSQPRGEALTREAFNKMSLVEMQQLKTQNPELYRQLAN